MERFEDVIAWQRARALNRAIYGVSASGPFGRDYGLRDQIRRASVSIMANIAEGFDRNGAREFRQLLTIAKGSCAEVRSHLYAALDAGYVDQDTFDSLKMQAEEVSRLISGLRTSIDRRHASR